MSEYFGNEETNNKSNNEDMSNENISNENMSNEDENMKEENEDNINLNKELINDIFHEFIDVRDLMINELPLDYIFKGITEIYEKAELLETEYVYKYNLIDIYDDIIDLYYLCKNVYEEHMNLQFSAMNVEETKNEIYVDYSYIIDLTNNIIQQIIEKSDK